MLLSISIYIGNVTQFLVYLPCGLQNIVKFCVLKIDFFSSWSGRKVAVLINCINRKDRKKGWRERRRKEEWREGRKRGERE